jgi:hypothetical protein
VLDRIRGGVGLDLGNKTDSKAFAGEERRWRDHQRALPLVIPKALSSVLEQAIRRRFVMPLYLKVVLPVAGLILSIFSLTVPEGARSQQPSDAIAQAQTSKEAPVERP